MIPLFFTVSFRLFNYFRYLDLGHLINFNLELLTKFFWNLLITINIVFTNQYHFILLYI
jgi:hypothetical protein